MNDAATEIVLGLATEFMEFMREREPAWETAYYRFRSEGSRYGANASYVVGTNVLLIGAVKWAAFYERMNDNAARLLEVLGNSQGVFLLTVSAGAAYDIRFEWENLRRWEITKLDGRTGMPSDL